MSTEQRDCVRIMGIDPGSRTLGISIVDCYPHEQQMTLVDSWTLVTEEELYRRRFRVVRVGELQVRLETVEEEVLYALQNFYPDGVIMETPYLGRLPQSFFVLTMVMGAIERAVKQYSEALFLNKIDPSTVKKDIGVPGNSNDKELVRQAVKALRCLENLSGHSIDDMSEHEVDATAVVHHFCVAELGFPRVS